MRRLDPPLSLDALARIAAARVVRGDPGKPIAALGSLSGAAPDELSFLASPRHAAQARKTRAGAVIASPALAGEIPSDVAILESADPQRSFAAVARRFAELFARPAVPGVHPGAHLEEGVSIGRDASIGPFVFVGHDAVVGDGAVLEAGVHVGPGSAIGARSHLHARVVVEHDCRIGDSCTVFPGTVIGADGFGFVEADDAWEKIPQLGSVVIGDSVEIGANCAIDRGALDDTVIGDGCKLDNLIQVAHNVRIGEHTAIAGCVGIAGSAQIGRRCRIGGGAGILGHLEICDDVTISAMSLVTRSIRQPGFYSGVFPLMDNADWERAAAMVRQLPQWRARLRALAKTDRTHE